MDYYCVFLDFISVANGFGRGKSGDSLSICPDLVVHSTYY
ncbi:hypothetical protein AALP_AA3G230800 [Arabis alpina]|uniref:Uncharacterized protein n=1 Tax=Arabis alpina TaxID=50452 RepID=A0A087HB30_ARAAL|nr:hypothetical protein AALP_AA3G230800 [Arabis alpina]